MKTKMIDWSYPSSANAGKFGFAKQGCWTVSHHFTGADCKAPVAVAGFSTENAAKAFAATLPEPWHPIASRRA